ncbi:MAG: sugar ABC transporter permease [candidate division WOR-3 bacterium]|nr:MAG: sugar ABC transporter permease [candidate division WOR-3 bacterium]
MRRRVDLSGYLFILPALLVIAIFRLYPILQAIRMSLFNWGIAGPLTFIGLKNFARLFIDPKFYESIGNTFWYVLFVVPLTIIISLFFASLLNQKIKGRSAYRTLYFLPVVTSIVAISVVWKWIFNPDRGIFNAALNLFGLSGLKWLNDSRGVFEILLAPLNIQVAGFFTGPSIALLALIIMAIWHNLGYCIIISLAGLQNVPAQYYEAARIDGARGWKLFRHVTLPIISPTIFYLLVTQSIIAFNTFTPVYVMTQPPGGPLGTTSLVVYYLYEQSFRLWNLGYANAIAFVIFIIIFSLTQLQKRFLEQRVYYE